MDDITRRAVISGLAASVAAPIVTLADTSALPTQYVKINYTPRHVFRPFHNSRKRKAIIVAHRRAGKTVAAVRHLERAAMTHPLPLPRFAYIAPTYKQAKDIAWMYVQQTYHQLRDYASINESELRIDFPNGGRVRLYGADNPDSLRGLYFDGAVIDESALADPRLYKEILIPALTDRNGWVGFIGTPKGQNYFYQLLREAQKDPETWYWAIHKASETGILSPQQLLDARAAMSLSEYNQEFECSFDEGSVNQFIDGNTVIAAQERVSVPTGPVIIGADISRFGDDRTIIIIRRGRRLLEVRKHWKMSVVETATKIIEAINYYATKVDVHCFVDGGGVGGGVVDILKDRGFPRIYDVQAAASASDKTKFLNKRAEMHFYMREWLRTDGDIRAGGEELAVDLTVTRYKYNNNGQLVLESKSDIKKRGMLSPDTADALAQTFAEHLPVEAALYVPPPHQLINARFSELDQVWQDEFMMENFG
jgi:hypothetical protein